MYDESVVKKLEEAFSKGANITTACFYADISRQTLYNWYEKDPELKERFDALQQNPVMKALDTIYSNLSDKETAKWYLERRNKDFKPKSDVTSDDKPIPLLNTLDNVSDNNGHKEDSEPKQENTSDTGGDVSEQDNLNTPVLDSLGSEG